MSFLRRAIGFFIAVIIDVILVKLMADYLFSVSSPLFAALGIMLFAAVLSFLLLINLVMYQPLNIEGDDKQ